MSKIAIMILAILLPGVAAAHPGHASGGDFGLLHFLTDPFHVGMTVAAILVFLAARRAMLRRLSSQRMGR